jgi:hypothetical protein
VEEESMLNKEEKLKLHNLMQRIRSKKCKRIIRLGNHKVGLPLNEEVSPAGSRNQVLPKNLESLRKIRFCKI